jgi:outer membrane lipoprotein-sorting protein
MRTTFAAALAALLAAVAVMPAAAQAAPAKPDFVAILKAIDQMNDFSGTDFTGVFTIVSDKPDGAAGKVVQTVTQVRMFRRDAKKQFLMLMQLPEVNRGQGYLKEGDNLFMYDPTSRKFTHSTMKETLNESEAQNADFGQRTILDDYDILGGEAGMLGKFPVWVISLKAKTNDVSYDMVKLYVRQDQPLVLKQEDLSVSGRLMRTTLYPKYANIGNGRFFPSQMLIVDELNPGEKSQVTMTELSTAPLSDKVFTKAFLEQAN